LFFSDFLRILQSGLQSAPLKLSCCPDEFIPVDHQVADNVLLIKENLTMAQLNTPRVNHASDIIQVLNSGIEFYTDAKEQVRDQRLVQFFDRMLTARCMVKERLQPFAVQEDGKREEGSAFSVEVRKVYTKVISAISSDTEHTYISQLEEVEDKTLEELRIALKDNQPPQYEAALLQSMATMQECHDEMRALKLSVSH
jgi:uncharacterized protein (TIGR02284 family)